MKKILIAILSVLLIVACSPIEKDYLMGQDYTVDQLDISVRAVVINGKNTNKLIFENHSPILGEWDYSFGVTSQQVVDTAIIVIDGPLKITFKGLNPSGSIITKDFEINVEDLYFPVPPEWGLLCGNGTKVWEWDVDAEDGPFGEGGFREGPNPDWWGVSLSDLDGGWWNAPGWGEGAAMSFSVRGAAFSKTNATNTKTENGAFVFDMSQKLSMYWDDDIPWSIGKLRIMGGTSVLGGKVPDFTDWFIYDVYEFYILELSDEKLILSYEIPGPDGGGAAWFWHFRAKSE